MEEKSVAIDGPSGAGKSTLARMTAERFGLIYVDTGALYRCVGLAALQRGLSMGDETGVASMLPELNIEMRYDGGGIQRMFIGGGDVTDEIRLPEVSLRASDASKIPAVRAFLLDRQKAMAVKYDVIMDGRDIGTVVLPGAGLKIFLTAPPDVRAGRRYRELAGGSAGATFEDVLRDINLRDQNDSAREHAPLKAAEDAIVVDTAEMGLDESFETLCSLIRRRFGI
jgi:cytidylate kinase